jgi:hypothetical protein
MVDYGGPNESCRRSARSFTVMCIYWFHLRRVIMSQCYSVYSTQVSILVQSIRTNFAPNHVHGTNRLANTPNGTHSRSVKGATHVYELSLVGVLSVNSYRPSPNVAKGSQKSLRLEWRVVALTDRSTTCSGCWPGNWGCERRMEKGFAGEGSLPSEHCTLDSTTFRSSLLGDSPRGALPPLAYTPRFHLLTCHERCSQLTVRCSLSAVGFTYPAAFARTFPVGGWKQPELG